MEASKTRVTVVIPAKNEAGSLRGVIEGARPHADEIIVVDGRSTDATVSIARDCGASVITEDGSGKGRALRLGAEKAGGEVLVFLDADGSHDPADIPRLVEPIARGDADMVIGSRMLGGSDELHGTWDNFIRNTGSCLLAVLVNSRWKTRLTDIENGYRAIRKEAMLTLGATQNGFLVEQEMVLRGLRQGLRIAEVASHERERQAGESKLPTRQGWTFVWHFFREILKR